MQRTVRALLAGIATACALSVVASVVNDITDWIPRCIRRIEDEVQVAGHHRSMSTAGVGSVHRIGVVQYGRCSRQDPRSPGSYTDRWGIIDAGTGASVSASPAAASMTHHMLTDGASESPSRSSKQQD